MVRQIKTNKCASYARLMSKHIFMMNERMCWVNMSNTRKHKCKNLPKLISKREHNVVMRQRYG